MGEKDCGDGKEEGRNEKGGRGAETEQTSSRQRQPIRKRGRLCVKKWESVLIDEERATQGGRAGKKTGGRIRRLELIVLDD